MQWPKAKGLNNGRHPVVSEVRFAQSLALCVGFCGLLFVFYLLAIALSVLRFTASDYFFRIYLQSFF
jgi:hypothetical protein